MTDHIATPTRAGLMGAGHAAKLEKLLVSSSSTPGISDDSTKGYFPGAKWWHTTSDAIYVCVSAAVGAAVWKPAGSGGGGSGELGAINVAFINGLTRGSY